LILIFSFFTPVGILLGIFLSDFKSKVIEGAVLAMSSGTFIYVAASEVIVEEFAITKYKFQKFFAFIIGGVLVAGLAVFEKLGDA
jgi:zinc transporter 1/2/3